MINRYSLDLRTLIIDNDIQARAGGVIFMILHNMAGYPLSAVLTVVILSVRPIPHNHYLNSM